MHIKQYIITDHNTNTQKYAKYLGLPYIYFTEQVTARIKFRINFLNTFSP